MIQTYNLPNHYKGDTFNTKQISFGFDITDALIKMQFKTQVNAPVAFAWLTSDNTISIIDALTGIVTMNAKVIDVAVGTYIYDCQITFSDGRVQTFFGGTMTITQDISK
jgi:hypothetical protein